MKKRKIIVVGLLAGGAALTGLAGSAYAEGGTTVPGPGKPHGPAGRPVAISCFGTSVHGGPVPGGKAPGKAVTGKAVTGKAVTGKAVTGEGGEPVLKGKAGAKLPPLPPPGKTVFKTGGGGNALPAPPPGAKVLDGGTVKVFTDGKGTMKIKPPKGVRCSVSHPGTPPPVDGKPPVSTRPAPGS